MSEFAFSGVGINPHFPPLANAATLELDPTPRIPGGSTSGAARSVAAGAAWARSARTPGARSDPAALQGLVGFKSTARLVPIDGAVPLSTTLDTVCAITRSVRDAIAVHEVLASRPVQRPARPAGPWRFAVPTRMMLDGLDATVARAFERSLAALSAAGARIDAIELAPLAELVAINASGGFAAAESWAFHRRWLARREAEYDPRVARRIRRGEAMSAADYLDLVSATRDWIGRMETPCRTSTPSSRRPCRWSRRRSRRWSTTTTPSSPSTASSCATRAASTSSTAAPSACRATAPASCRSA
jgi:amidase/aspartyl-tRNA(Asn)/glutamyl-tRNA(Gln) amidotransferase subunit A